MKNGLYTVFDRIAGVSQVVQLPNDTIALRFFRNAFQDNESFKKNASDFVGVRIGWIDTENAEIEADYEELIECYEVQKGGEEMKNEDK